MNETAAVAEGWDTLYREGRYTGEAPIPFVDTVLEHLSPEDRQGFGLYVGCGNGRNYLPLFRLLGPRLRGVDVSTEGIRQIREQAPETEQSTFVGDFRRYCGANIFRYIVAIQSFQHGDTGETNEFFKRSSEALMPGGKLFLRVNSSSTNLVHRHRRHGTKKTGKFVEYLEGPKTGQTIRYYTEAELAALAKGEGFSIVKPLAEVKHRRVPPLTGHWVQWESVWERK